MRGEEGGRRGRGEERKVRGEEGERRGRGEERKGREEKKNRKGKEDRYQGLPSRCMQTYTMQVSMPFRIPYHISTKKGKMKVSI